MKHLARSLYHKMRKMNVEMKRKIRPIGRTKKYELKSVTEFAKENGCPLLPAGKQENAFFMDPPIVDCDGYHPPSKTPIISPTNVPYVTELSNALIYSKSTFVIVGKYALSDTVAHPQYGKYIDLQYDRTFHKRKNDKISLFHADHAVKGHEGAILLSGPSSEAFGHWPNEFLPRLEFLEYHPDFKKLPLIVDENMPQSHFDYLELMTENDLVRLKTKSALLCKKLLVAPTPCFLPHLLLKNASIPSHEIALSPERLQFMRDRVSPKIKGKSPYGHKLYLARRNCTWRRLINEAEIEAFLHQKGFETVLIETLSFKDQVRMFREAKWIVAPNGSSLLNLIYAPTDIKVFVLAQMKLHNWGGFYGAMKMLGYDMLFVLGDIKNENIHSDYSVPVQRLGQAFALYG